MASAPTSSPASPILKRSLKTWAAVSLSIAAMGASLAINLNPQGAGATVGRAVPLTFLLATIGVLLVAYGFARVCSKLSHAGSVFGLTGATIGPRAGVIAGWSLLGAYLAFIITTAMTAGIFGADFLRFLGVYDTTPDIVPWLLALFSLGIALILGVSPIKTSMKTLLWVEIVTIALIVIIMIVVVAKVSTVGGPGGQHFTLDMFTVPPGVEPSALFLGIVFGFLSFAGFEASAALGEEAENPKKAIPRAIFAVPLFGGVFYILGTAVQMLGYGTDASGVQTFSASASLFGDLGQQYIAAPVGGLVTLGTAISAIGCCLATVVAAARLLFAMNRGVMPERGLARLSPKSGAPIRATVFVAVLAAFIIALTRGVFTTKAFDLFAASGTIGTLVLLVAYALFSAGAWYFLVIRSPRRDAIKAAPLDYVVPILAVALVLYTLYSNLIPWPSTGAGQANVFIAGVWTIAIIAVALFAPRLARRIAKSIDADEGLTVTKGSALDEADRFPADVPASEIRS
ncbi:APC family permease [Arthrobacter sp. 2MCAF14]|uniref:APC family permease n=1 Tax=Arthrobacter sp. 2MCAF14 TaxID=3232982 RepID=UPI003F927AAE